MGDFLLDFSVDTFTQEWESEISVIKPSYIGGTDLQTAGSAVESIRP